MQRLHNTSPEFVQMALHERVSSIAILFLHLNFTAINLLLWRITRLSATRQGLNHIEEYSNYFHIHRYSFSRFRLTHVLFGMAIF